MNVFSRVLFRVPVAGVCCLLFGSTWIYLLQPPSEEVTPNYGFAVVLICVACFTEKLVEPFFVAAQALRFVRTKVSVLYSCDLSIFFLCLALQNVIEKFANSFFFFQVVIEGLAQLVKVVEFAVLVSRFSDTLDPVLAFCYAQLSASLVYSISYFLVFAVLLSSDGKLHFAFFGDMAPKEGFEPEKTETKKENPFNSFRDFLPDTTFFTEVRIHSRTVTLSGPTSGFSP